MCKEKAANDLVQFSALSERGRIMAVTSVGIGEKASSETLGQETRMRVGSRRYASGANGYETDSARTNP